MTPNGTGQGEHHDPDAWNNMRMIERRLNDMMGRIEKLERGLERLDRIVERVVTKERPS